MKHAQYSFRKCIFLKKKTPDKIIEISQHTEKTEDQYCGFQTFLRQTSNLPSF